MNQHIVTIDVEPVLIRTPIQGNKELTPELYKWSLMPEDWRPGVKRNSHWGKKPKLKAKLDIISPEKID
jgi:hypothetical protein